MNLPAQPDLPVNRLAACFNHTALTYKFYWFLAVIGRAEQGETSIGKRQLFAEMVAHSWFTVNYFHISFGKQDKLQQAIEYIRQAEGLTVDANRASIFNQLVSTGNKTTVQQLKHFDAEVPHRFLSPWFPAGDRAKAYELSQSFTNSCPYAVHKEHIEINPEWITYLRTNAGILKSFCYWHLALYLQQRNPNVPDIPNKLIKIPVRKALTQQRNFWDLVIAELGGVDCIYTNTRLQAGNYAVEHFIPYAFVSHDLIWNLIPADPSFNSSKSDKLPILDLHFKPFFELQSQAAEIVKHRAPKNKLLEDYLPLFPLFEHEPLNQEKFLEQVQPLVTIASNNGFQFM